MFLVNTSQTAIPSSLQTLSRLLAMPKTKEWADFRSRFMTTWGRSPGQERWELPNVTFPAPTHTDIIQLLSDIGFIRERLPKRKQYDYAFLPGAVLHTMKRRLDWLCSLWEQGVRFETLVVFTGERPSGAADILPMDLLIRARASGTDLPESSHYPKTEIDAARMLLAYTDFPDGMESVPVQFVHTPPQDHDGIIERPCTADTVREWRHQDPEPGNALMITNQPFAPYQGTTFRKELPEFTVDVSCPGHLPIPPGSDLAVLLDAVSTWLRACGSRPPEPVQ